MESQDRPSELGFARWSVSETDKSFDGGTRLGVVWYREQVCLRPPAGRLHLRAVRRQLLAEVWRLEAPHGHGWTRYDPRAGCLGEPSLFLPTQ